MTAKSWRDVLKVHPAAELFPLMATEELLALGEDILKNGLSSPIIYWSDDEVFLLDGRNRLDAMERVGIRLVKEDGCMDYRTHRYRILSTTGHDPLPDPYSYVISANIHRRHLTNAQKSQLIATLLKAQPDRSDRAIARSLKVDNQTVAAKRKMMERGEEIPHHEKRIGSDGKAQSAKKPKTATKRNKSAPKGPSIAEQFAVRNRTPRFEDMTPEERGLPPKELYDQQYPGAPEGVTYLNKFREERGRIQIFSIPEEEQQKTVKVLSKIITALRDLPDPDCLDRLNERRKADILVLLKSVEPQIDKLSASIPQRSEVVDTLDPALSIDIPCDPKKAAAVITKRWPAEHVIALMGELHEWRQRHQVQQSQVSVEVGSR